MMSRDRRYDSFKTWSGKLERQLAHLAGAGPEFPEEEEDGCDAISSHHTKSMPQVDRFFAALECPELDKLRSSEELVLPLDKTWPFLLRFPVSAFGICLGVSTQAILWKTVATSAPTRFLHVTTKTVVLKVGMSCQGCAGAVRRVLTKMEGVETFDIDMEQQKVTVKGNVKPEDVFQTVSKTGKKTSFWEAAEAASDSAAAAAPAPAPATAEAEAEAEAAPPTTTAAEAPAIAAAAAPPAPAAPEAAPAKADA
ncbi:Os02g0530100 [Oryza sativa Japonica Group]|uniref:Copper chaperone n=3 Tax=Oryza sativa subsp. japonica TaxID=39947 RepID=B7E2X3_ORYSJ|nr:hypothetical protein DAI22_02g193950 [Oryza sativa Japonica Group]BAD73816.1 putative copper chaperone [Oryza sativa Japonica Group]BAG86720.1 unnamed protein product [Oryza sativa Japonica Group]BAH91730.1 Os02g0530100 [Oryza sativa Japonica Group]|eukprot:NP_001173001.1 Os02g0530100 [Oryza sativa Japonica Group]